MTGQFFGLMTVMMVMILMSPVVMHKRNILANN
jgi:hypothetical protein